MNMPQFNRRFLRCLTLAVESSDRFISDDIDSQEAVNPPKGTYQKLAHRNDGQPVGDF